MSTPSKPEEDLVKKVNELSNDESVVEEPAEADAAMIEAVKATLLKDAGMDAEMAGKIAMTLLSDESFMATMKEQIGGMLYEGENQVLFDTFQLFLNFFLDTQFRIPNMYLDRHDDESCFLDFN